MKLVESKALQFTLSAPIFYAVVLACFNVTHAAPFSPSWEPGPASLLLGYPASKVYLSDFVLPHRRQHVLFPGSWFAPEDCLS